jgi:imidazole glycerol-phosphate synthase subunit HisH
VIAVVDGGTGNLRSVENALSHVGGRVTVTADPDVVRRADRIVVPGQGAFRDCLAGLRARGLDEAIRESIHAGKPYLGICLGLQLLFDESEEHGPIAGLGILPGKVIRFRDLPRTLKVPHMGWNSVTAAREEPLWRGIPEGAFAYFVHSYHAVPADPTMVALTSDYGGPICAAVRKDNVFACQFHPEKSQRVGLTLLESFVTCA